MSKIKKKSTRQKRLLLLLKRERRRDFTGRVVQLAVFFFVQPRVCCIEITVEVKATPLQHRKPTLATVLSTLAIPVSCSFSSPSRHLLSPPLLG